MGRDLGFEKYEKDCKQIREENEKLLEGFVKHLEKSGLKEKTIDQHYQNVDVFLNTFLLYYEANTAAEGIDMIGDYLGDFFIRKCMWSTPARTKQTIASFKKFYAYMETIGKVTTEELQDMHEEIKELSGYWIDSARSYNDPEEDWD